MKYKLKEIFDLHMGKTPSRNNAEYWNSNEYKWISIADLSKTGKYIRDTKEHLSKQAIDESGIKLIPANTVIMSFKLSIGKTAITAEDMYSNEAIMAFHDKHVVDILPEYLFYMFKFKNWDEGSNKAVMGKTLNKATLSDVEIDVCSIEKQREIVDILNKIMNILENRDNEIVLLDNLIKARFVEMFGNARENPKGYKMVLFNDIVEYMGDIGSNGANKVIVADTITIVKTEDMNELEPLQEKGLQIKKLTDQITEYLASLFSAGTMTEQQAAQTASLMYILSDVERMGTLSVEVAKCVQEKIENRYKYTPEAMEELQKSLKTLEKMFTDSIKALQGDKSVQTEKLIKRKDKIMDLDLKMRKAHVQRVNKGKCKASLTAPFTNILHLIDRMGNSCVNLADVASNEISLNYFMVN